MTSRANGTALITLIGALCLSACASSGPREGFAATDDAEPFNRSMHSVNVTLDEYALRPAAQAYDFATPALIQHMIGNGLNHIDLTKDFANHLLQGEFEASLRTFGRFTVNSILGMGGLLDPATEVGLPKETTDFGLTLASYDVDEGTYLVLPLVGPSTARDTFGFLVDTAFSPLTYVGPFTALDGLSPAVTAVDTIDARNRNADIIDEVLYNSEDSYVTLRSAYLQRRRSQSAGEEGAVDNLPDIFEEEAPAN